MADRKAFVIEPDFTDKIKFCKSYLGSKIKYRRFATVINIEIEQQIETVDDPEILIESQWVDVSYSQWVAEPYKQWIDYLPATLHQIWMDQIYVYVATSIGLDVIDIETSNKVSYIDNIEGFTSVWSSEDVVYLGTNDDGLKYIEKETISGSESAPYNLENNLKDYNYYYNTSSNQIKYLHGYNDTLAVVTGSGIDILNNTVNSFKSTTSNINVTKCFLTPANEIYYIVQGTAEDGGIFKMNTVLCDWIVPDISYISGESFLPGEISINDIFVTVNTSLNNIDNTLFVATTLGAYVYDEETAEYDVYSTK